MAKNDDYARHEVLHMSLFLAESVDEQLAAHPAIKDHPAWRRLAETASEALHDLYQAIGSEHL